MSSYQFASPRKRRSTRIDQAVPLVVHGVGALREPYQEEVTTLSVSCHGCRYLSKHEVIQGDTVYLGIRLADDRTASYSSKAQVKWAKKAGTKEKAFQIAVELENAGNIWGIAAAPADWFPPQATKTLDAAAPGRELKVVSRKDQQIMPVPNEAPVPTAQIARTQEAAQPIPALAQLMVGLSEQIQSMASDAASTALTRDKNRLLDEFRAELRTEALKAIQSVISASKDVITRQALKDFNEAQETAARNSHALWRKQVEQDLESARNHMLTQGKELAQQLDAMAASTIDRMQNKLEVTRREGAEQFALRVREQIEPIVAAANDSLQKLRGAEMALRKESEAIFAGIENQLAFTTNDSLAKALEDLERMTAAQTAQTNEALQQLHQNFEQASKENVEILLNSLRGQVTQFLQEKANEVSREFSTGLEDHTRNYLESIGKSIAGIPQLVQGRQDQ